MENRLKYTIAILLLFGPATALASSNPLNLAKDCYKNDECVVKALERSANNEIWSGANPFTGIKYISDSQFWHNQRSHDTNLWKTVIKVCPALNGGHYPTVRHTDMLVVGCQEAEFGE